MDLSLRKLRKNIAAFTVMALLASFMIVGTANAAVATDVYDDVDGTEWYAGDVQWGLDNGILDDTQAYFRAGDNATRAEFFKMTAAGAGIPEAACDETLFPDLSADHWACGWVTAMAEAGIVSGDGASAENPGYVRPNDNIVRAESGKVVVEAYGLIGSSMGSDVFGDVDAAAWYDEYAGIAYDNCVFQGAGGTDNLEPGRNIVRAEAIAVVNRGANPTSECDAYVGPTGALTVSVDGSTPDSSLIPQNATGVSYVIWGLEASNDEDILVEGITVTRQGLGEPEDFDEVRLYVDGVQQGSKKNVNTTTNQADFALAGDPINVPSGGELLLEGVADMDTINQNSENALCIMSADDVTAIGADSGEPVTVGGSFPACGEYMTTTSARVGDVLYTTTDFGGDINVGDTDVDMLRLRLEVDGEDGMIDHITVKQEGSADPDDFANLMWYHNNAPVEGVDCMWSGDFYSCDFAPADKSVVDGGVINLDLRVDVVGGIGNTAAFDIDRDTDILVIGDQYGYGMNVAEGGGSLAPVPRDIVGGRLAFSTSANNPTVGDVAPNADDHEFLGFNIATAGDAVDLLEFELDVVYGGLWGVETEVDDLKVWKWDEGTEAWKIAASSLDPAAGCGNPCTLTYEDTITLPASETTQFMATMDVDNNAPDGATYAVNFLATGLDAEYTVDTDPVLAADISGLPMNGNVQTVAPANLTVEVSSSPGDQFVVKNQPEVDLVGFDLTASTASDLVVRTMEVTCTDLAGPGTCDDFFTNLEMYHKDGGSLFFLDDATFSGGAGVFNNINLDIVNGQTEKTLARADVTSSPTNADVVTLEILQDSDVSADDEFGFALDSGASPDQIDVCEGVGADACLNADGETPILGFFDNGAIEVSIEDTLNDEIILDGTSDVLVGELTIRETTDSEDILLRELRLTNDVDLPGCTDTGVSSVKIPYPDSENPYSAALQVGNISEFSFQTTGDRKVIVPRDGNIVLPFTVDTNSIGGGGTFSGECINLQVVDLDGTDYDVDIDIEAVGAASGELLGNADIVGDAGYVADLYIDGANTFTIRNNKPTITTNYELGSGQDLYGFGQVPTTADPVLGFNISVEGTGTMTIYDIDLVADATVGCAGVANHLLYRELDWLGPSPTAIADDGADGTLDAADFTNGVGIQVVGGADEDYVLVTDTSGAGYACTFDVNNPDLLEFSIQDNGAGGPEAFLWDDQDAAGIDDTGITNDTVNADTTMIFG